MDADLDLIAGSQFSQQPRQNPQQIRIGFTWFILGLAIATLGLMALGSATRVMNAGLSCPDWPLCYGSFLPRQQMNLQVFLEWFHRWVATSIGLLTILMCGFAWWQRQNLPRWTPWATLGALGLVMFQGILGGLTVTQLLRFDIVTAHLGTGLLFFSTLLVIGTSLMPFQAKGTSGQLFGWSLAAGLLVYTQSILGALVASRWALHQCFGASQLCTVMNSHIAGVFPATIAILGVVWLSWKHKASLNPTIKVLNHLVATLLILQVTLGITTFKLHLQVEPLTVAHQAIGASLLGTLVALTVFAWRDRNTTPVILKTSIEIQAQI
jgi:heme a synthase